MEVSPSRCPLTIDDVVRDFHVSPSETMQRYYRQNGGDSTFEDDPHRLYGEMREHCPVAWSERYGGFWVVSSYAEVHAALRDTETFSSYPATIPNENWNTTKTIPLEYDPPEHTAYRKLLLPMFSIKQVARIEDRIREHCDRLIDDFIDSGECEIISDFAQPLPSIVFMEFVGWPVEDAARLIAWTRAIVHPQGTDTEIAAQRKRAMREAHVYFMDFISQRRAAPSGDLTSKLMEASLSGERPLTDAEIYNILALLMNAGLDTTTSAIGNTLAYFAEHPDEQARIATEPDVIPDLIEELLRFESQIAAGRTATRDVQLGGAQIRAGDRVMLLTASAGRDSSEFEGADKVDISRFPNRHLGFGVGPHRCLGSNLARLELRVALTEFFKRIPRYAVAPGEKICRHVNELRGVDTLPIVFGQQYSADNKD